MLKTAIVGLGHVAAHQIAAMSTSDNFELVAGCDSDPSRFELLDPTVANYTDIHVMLEREDLDVVVIASPNRLHVDHGTAVMSSGKWLVMEKPLAETQEEFERFASNREKYGGNCTLALHAAFGPELLWFFSEHNSRQFDLDDIASINARFYDPYFANGRIQEHALSLGGSWLDSGVNALSVIGRFVSLQHMTIVDSRMTRVDGSRCTEVQGTVEFEFPGATDCSSGFIDTNWTIDRDSKSTSIRFSKNNSRLIFDHSAQKVILSRSSKDDTLFVCENGLPRLTNHYVGVFGDLALQIEHGKDNFEYCRQLHRFLYDAGNIANTAKQ